MALGELDIHMGKCDLGPFITLYGKINLHCLIDVNTVTRHLAIGLCSEKRVIRQFCHCLNITEYTCTNTDGLAY